MHARLDLPPENPDEGLLLRRQDGPCAPPRRRGRLLFPVASAPVRQDPSGGHAAGAVRGKRGAVPGPRRARQVGLVDAPPGRADQLRRGQFRHSGLRSERCGGPAGGDGAAGGPRTGACRGVDPFPAPALHERPGRRAVVLVDEQAGRARRPGTGAGQPRLPARLLRDDQGQRQASPFRFPDGGEQVGWPVFGPEQPASRWLRSSRTSAAARTRNWTRSSPRNSRAWTGTKSAAGTTATTGAGRRSSTIRSASCCCSPSAGSATTGSRAARRPSWSRRWRAATCPLPAWTA